VVVIRCRQIIARIYPWDIRINMEPVAEAIAISNGQTAEKRSHRQSLLQCGICSDKYTDPKLLPCLHTFCRSCLQEYIPAHSLSVTCPTCRQQSILPQDGVTALQGNLFVVRLMEVLDNSTTGCALCQKAYALSTCTVCNQNLCFECATAHGKDASTSSHDVTSILAKVPPVAVKVAPSVELGELGSRETALVCCQHDNQPLEIYCGECETAVCLTCTDGEHRDHPTLLLSDAIREHREMMTELLQQAQDAVPSMENALSSVRDVSESLIRNHRTAERRIKDAFDSLARAMSQRRDALLAELDSAFANKHKTLQEQSDSLDDLILAISGCCEFTLTSLKHGDENALLAKKEMSEKLNQLCSTSALKNLPEENDFLAFDAAELSSAKKYLRNFGSIRTNSAVAYETSASGEALKHCWINRQGAVTITTKDRHGELIKVGHSSFTARMSSGNGNNEAFVPDITDNYNGTYELTYLVHEPGIYVLEIQLYGQPIKGSPFRIKAHRETDSLERPKSAASKLQSSAVKQRGTKRASSSRSQGSNRKSNPVDDDLLMCIGSKGRNKGEFLNPQGIATQGNKILIADSNNQCVQVFSNSGDCLLRFGTRGRQAGQLQRPTGVGVSAHGNYLVADYDNKWVSVFDPEGKYLNKIGAGKLLGPKGICVDKEGHIIIVDNKASCVLIYQSNGKLLHKFGSRGNDDRHFAGPHFCAVNSANDIIITDFHHHCVKVFDTEGTYRFCFGSPGEGNGQFNAPTGVAVDKHNNILVADWGNSRIQVGISA